MDANIYINIIIKAVGIVLGALVAYLIPKADAWLRTKTSQQAYESLSLLVKTIVQSAQQQLWQEPGEQRKAYVIEQLTALGYEVTDEINSMIEAAVYQIHTEADQ